MTRRVSKRYSELPRRERIERRGRGRRARGGGGGVADKGRILGVGKRALRASLVTRDPAV